MNKFLALMLSVVFAGCTSAGTFQSSLEERKGALGYVYDSEKMVQKKAVSVTVSSFTVDDLLAADTVVQNKSSFVLPLLFFNMWKQEDQARLGYSQLENDYKRFLRDSFLEELKRSCICAYREDHGDIALDIRVKKIEMSAPIHQNGDFIFAVFFVAMGANTTAGPVDVAIDADVKASRGNAVVFSKELRGKFRTNILPGKKVNMQDYTTAMIEGLSLAIKNMNENIVKEVNKI